MARVGTITLAAFSASLPLFCCAPAARAQLPGTQLLTNGNFEAGGGFAAGTVPGWTLTGQTGSAGNFFWTRPARPRSPRTVPACRAIFT